MFRLILVFHVLPLMLSGQNNLIFAPSFEENSNPVGTWTVCYPGTPDHYSPINAAPPGSFLGSPVNGMGYQNARTGGAYMGIVIQSNNQMDTNKIVAEHFRTTLSSPLKANTCYNAGLYFVNGNYSKRFANRMGIYFSSVMPTKSNPQDSQFDVFLKPQIALDSSHFFTDTLNWMLLGGVFKAQGGEKYIIYGNFYNKENTSWIPKAPMTNSVNVPQGLYGDTNIAYVLIDDVFLYEIPSALSRPDTALCKGQSIPLGLNNDTTTAVYNWLPQSGLSCANCPNPIATPSANITYTLTKTVKGCSTQSKTTLTVHPKPQPQMQLTTTTACLNTALVLQGSPPGGSYLGSTANDSVFIAPAPGNYTLAYAYTNAQQCSDTSSVKSVTIYPLPIKPSIDEQYSSLCLSKKQVSLSASPAGGVFSGDNVKGTVFKTNLPGSSTIYYTISDTKQCSNSDTLIITVNDCAQGHFSIPNVFSPNGDGINEQWKIELPYGVSLQELEIYDRWGTKVYEKNGTLFPETTTILWEGYTSSALPCDAGSYFYILQTQSNTQETNLYKGSLSVMR